MKVMLVSIDAKFIHTNNAVRLLQANSTFPMEIYEYTIKDDIDTILMDIKKLQPDVIGCSVYIWNVNHFNTLLHHPDFPDTTVVLGGPEVSYDAPHFLQWNHVSYIIRGEGEIAFHQLLTHLQNQEPLDDLSNIAYLDGDFPVIRPIQEIMDLSTLNMPYYNKKDIPHIKHKITYIESSRGCPYKCSYCLSSLEEKVRFFPVKTVQKAIAYAMEHGSKTIKFLDRTFNANRHTLDIIDYIISMDNNMTVFQFEITGDVLPQELIKYINEHARKGLFRFEIGIQSTNEQTNRLVDRHQNTPRLFDRITQIQDANIIDLHLDLIAGLPKEDKQSFIRTFNEVFHLGAKELQLGFLKMLRGTKIRRQADLYDYQYQTQAPYEIISNDSLSKEDINEIKQVEHMLELYHNKGYFGEQMLQYILTQESPYHFFLKLARLYEEQGYSLHNYQLEDIYQRVFKLVDEDTIFGLIIDYLSRFTIKPKIFFDNLVPKDLRNKIYESISTIEGIPLHLLYKHSVLTIHKNQYFCAYYHHNDCLTFKGKAPN